MAFKFLKTLNGTDKRLNDIKGAINVMDKEISTLDFSKVKDVKKIYNKNVYETV